MRRPRILSDREDLENLDDVLHFGKTRLQREVEQKIAILRAGTLSNLRRRFANIDHHERLLQYSRIQPIQAQLYGLSVYGDDAVRLLAQQSLAQWMKTQ